jgi:hypothetical protein
MGKEAVHYATVNNNFRANTGSTHLIRESAVYVLALDLPCGVQENQTFIILRKENIKILYCEVTVCISPTVLCETQFINLFFCNLICLKEMHKSGDSVNNE